MGAGGEGTTGSDGRLRLSGDPGEPGDPAAGGGEPGVYRMTFGSGAYFQARGLATFYPEVSVTFEMTERAEHYHVPLLLSPFAYSTYRGASPWPSCWATTSTEVPAVAAVPAGRRPRRGRTRDGSSALGMILRRACPAPDHLTDITAYGGWRAYLSRHKNCGRRAGRSDPSAGDEDHALRLEARAMERDGRDPPGGHVQLA